MSESEAAATGMGVRVPAVVWSVGLSALAAALGGVGYVIVRYLLGSESALPRMFAGLYLIGGFATGLVPGAATGAIFVLFVAVLRALPRRVRIVVSGVFAGVIGTVLTCVILVALNEHFNAPWFVAVFSVASSSFLVGLGFILFKTSPASGG